MTLCCRCTSNQVDNERIAKFVRYIQIKLTVNTVLNQIYSLFIKAKSLIRPQTRCLHISIKYMNNVIDDTVKKNNLCFNFLK